MLAGYLPFDDDPANPEGDNINLLYKYIVSTPLTFPEYVTPHARDLLRRILVPDPRKRADLFEVARHSWLSEYAHVVGFITSTTTTSADIVESTIPTGKMSLQRKHIIQRLMQSQTINTMYPSSPAVLRSESHPNRVKSPSLAVLSTRMFLSTSLRPRLLAMLNVEQSRLSMLLLSHRL